MINSAALPSRSLFAWKLSKVQRICLVLLLVFTDTWHNICPPVSCLWKCPQIYTCPSPLATMFLSRANRLPPLRDAGNSVVKSPLMRLDIYETLFPFMAWERLQLQVGRLLDSTWAFLTPLVHTDQLKRARIAPGGGQISGEVWEHFPSTVRA